MTTFFQFIPSNRTAPKFMPTFDGNMYTVTIMWNVSAQRFYVNCQDSNSTLIFMVPLIESPNAFEILSLEWDQSNQRVLLETVEEHHFPVGEVLNITVINCSPDTFNGTGYASVLSPTQIIYPMVNFPGDVMTLGAVEILLSMTKSYFNSTLVYRNSQFEVSP